MSPRGWGYIPVSAGAEPGQGGIDITRDGGRHWVRLQPHGLEAGNISPVSAPEVWAVGCVQHADNCDALLHTHDTGRTWQVVHPVSGTPAARAAQTMVQGVAGVAPCRVAQLRGTAAWQGATGSLAGGITIVNRGPVACAVSGRPGVVIRGSNGDIARTVERLARAFEGAPVGTTVVVIGGSVIRPGGKPVIPTRTTCSAHVPHSGRAHLR